MRHRSQPLPNPQYTVRVIVSRLARKDEPDVGPAIPGSPPIISERRFDDEPCGFQPPHHGTHRQRSERQLEAVLGRAACAALEVLLFEGRQPPPPILTDRLDKRQVSTASCAAAQLDPVAILPPVRDIWDEIETEDSPFLQDSRDGRERRAGRTAEHRFELTFRTLPVRAMVRRLEAAGFVVDATLGDYQGRPWDRRSDVWLILARKRAHNCTHGILQAR